MYIYFLLSSLGKFRSDRQGERERENYWPGFVYVYTASRIYFGTAFQLRVTTFLVGSGKYFIELKIRFFFFQIISPVIVRRICFESKYNDPSFPSLRSAFTSLRPSSEKGRKKRRKRIPLLDDPLVEG